MQHFHRHRKQHDYRNPFFQAIKTERPHVRYHKWRIVRAPNTTQWPYKWPLVRSPLLAIGFPAKFGTRKASMCVHCGHRFRIHFASHRGKIVLGNNINKFELQTTVQHGSQLKDVSQVGSNHSVRRLGFGESPFEFSSTSQPVHDSANCIRHISRPWLPAR